MVSACAALFAAKAVFALCSMGLVLAALTPSNASDARLSSADGKTLTVHNTGVQLSGAKGDETLVFDIQ